MNSYVKLEQVSWSRDGKAVLSDMNWRAVSGEHWAIFGLNGSGKTTLLNLICGYIWPSTGQIEVLGEKYGEIDLRELRKSIGWVSSSLQSRIHGGESAQRLVVSGKFASIGIYEQPEPEDFDRARQLMDQLRCGHLWDRTYQTCSQGEQQKLLIARALMAKPKLLILDEAANGLDFISREGLLDSIAELGGLPDSPHMMYVTHHTEEILPLFSKTLLLRRGQIFKQGNTRDMLNSEVLSSFFELPVDVQWNHERAWLSRQM